jgi:2-octaprenyl-6-methoxyphenol hydroxylase
MHDILILGGGLVGNSLACALENTGLRVGLVEASTPSAGAPGFNERKLALSVASLNALTQLQVVQKFANGFSPIQRIHISRVGDFGSVDLKAVDYQRDFFGGVVMARDLGLALEQRIAALKNLQLYRPAKVMRVLPDAVEPQVDIEMDGTLQTLNAKLVIGADGTFSSVRSALNIEVDEFDYRQHLFVCTLQADRISDGTAYERFSPQGPVALLPMPGGQYGALCGVAVDEVKDIEQMHDADYIEYFQQRFGWRAGRIKRVGVRTHYPLKKQVAKKIVGPGCILMGNAAQTLHPMGAQGFNLGLRDALTLAEIVSEYGIDQTILSLYEKRRQQDREQTIAFSDGLARFTSQENTLAKTLRSIGLLATGLSPDLQAPIINGAMGFRGVVPALAKEAL